MPVSPDKSSQYANIAAVPPVLNDGLDHAGLKAAHSVLTLTAAGQGDAKMIRLPAGKLRIYPRLGRLVAPQGAAASTLSVGLGAYTKKDGTVASADVDALLVATSTAASAVTTALLGTAAGQVEFVEVESKDGVDVTITAAGGNTAASGDIVVNVPFQKASGE